MLAKVIRRAGSSGKKRRILRERLQSEDVTGDTSEDSVGAGSSSLSSLGRSARVTPTLEEAGPSFSSAASVLSLSVSAQVSESEERVQAATTEFFRIGIQDPLVRTQGRRRSFSAEHGESATGPGGTLEPLNLSRDAEFASTLSSSSFSPSSRTFFSQGAQYGRQLPPQQFPAWSPLHEFHEDQNPLNLSSNRGKLLSENVRRMGVITGAPTSVIVTSPNFARFSHSQHSAPGVGGGAGAAAAAAALGTIPPHFIDYRGKGIRKPGRPRKIITASIPVPGSTSFEERRGSIIVTPAAVKSYEGAMESPDQLHEDGVLDGAEEDEGTPDSTTTSSSGSSSNKQSLSGEAETGEGGAQKKKKKSKDYYCDKCDRWFSQLRNYRYHMSRHEGTFIFACTCPECGKRFNDKGYLSSHMKIHRNLKEYVCEYCGKSFNQRVAYNMHTRIHTGLKPHQCKLCPKAFSRKMLLRQHERTHTGERPFHCSVCDKSFADRSNMLLHERLHTGERPYKCEQCGKAFSKNHHLKTHMNHHLGIRPYQCPQCHATFTQSSNMKTHMKKCTGTLHLTEGIAEQQQQQQVELGGFRDVLLAGHSSATSTATSPSASVPGPYSPYSGMSMSSGPRYPSAPTATQSSSSPLADGPQPDGPFLPLSPESGCSTISVPGLYQIATGSRYPSIPVPAQQQSSYPAVTGSTGSRYSALGVPPQSTYMPLPLASGSRYPGMTLGNPAQYLSLPMSTGPRYQSLAGQSPFDQVPVTSPSRYPSSVGTPTDSPYPPGGQADPTLAEISQLQDYPSPDDLQKY